MVIGRHARLRRPWAVAGALLLAVLTACGPLEVESSPAPQPPPVAAAESAAAGAPEPARPPAPAQTPTSPPPAPPPTVQAAPAPRSAAPTAAAAPEPSPAPAAAETPAPSDDELAARLRRVVQESIRQEFPTAVAQPMHLLPLDAADARVRDWAVVTDGPQPSRLAPNGDPINFFHFAAVFRLDAERAWTEVARLEIESAPQRTRPRLVQSGWRPPDGAPMTWLLVEGGTGAHAGTLDLIGFDGSTLSSALSLITPRTNAGGLADLDGDGLLEVVVDDSDPYVFCYACATELKRETVYRWDGSRLAPVELRALASELPERVQAQVDRALALVGADLWREAAAAAASAAGQAPDVDDLRWLSILINRTASLRLASAGQIRQPLVTAVFAGEYRAAVDLMRAHEPPQTFALNGPLVVGTAAEHDVSTLAVRLLDFTERALALEPQRAAAHAVRALGLALASPDQLADARAAMRRAAELEPDDAFYSASLTFLQSVDQAPGEPPQPPGPPEPPAEPPPSFFADGQGFGSGDRGRHVKAVHQRLARIPSLQFRDPGRYFDAYHEPTRQAVVQFQTERGLTPSGVVDLQTWTALKEASEAPPPTPAPPPPTPAPATPTPQPTAPTPAPVTPAPQPTSPTPAPAPPPAPQPRAVHGDAGQPVAYLTFDDGPHPSYTRSVLEILARHGALGTFFVLGAQVTQFPEAVAETARQGNDVENHTLNHVSLVDVSRERFIAEVNGTDAAIRAAAGGLADPLRCLRPPYGARNQRTDALTAEVGKVLVLWDVDPQDWRQPGAAQIAAHVLSHAHPGAILLFHDGGGSRQQTIAALDTVLTELSARGYVFRALPACT